MKTKKIFLLFCFFLTFSLIYSQTYPIIEELQSKNVVFKQFQEDIEYSNKQVASRKNPSISFYQYKVKNNETLIKISARCGLTYDTIATCNSITEANTSLEGIEIILPTLNGLFIPLQPENVMEILLFQQYSGFLTENNVPIYKINKKDFFFIQNHRFDQAARAFFLDSSMRLPLEDSVLTSSYGMRVSPISGNWKMHNGIDMAAPKGSLVYSCKSGIVKKIVKKDSVYGNYIIIQHNDGLDSLYAHLSEILVDKNQTIGSGVIIGKVGDTGLATGPHLHFEIHINGSSTDPAAFF